MGKFKNKKIIFISSMGGHMSELLMLGETINRYDSYIVTEKTEVTKELEKTLIDRNINVKDIEYLPYGTKKDLFKYLFIFSWMIIKSLIIFLKIRPDVVITTGAHTAVPMVYISKLFRKKVVYIETFANINQRSVTSKLVSKISDKNIVQWEKMLEIYPEAEYWGGVY